LRLGDREFTVLISAQWFTMNVKVGCKMSREDDPITRAFIGQAMKVHSRLGPGWRENLYHQEIKTALREAGIRFQPKPRAHLFYRGIIADTFEPDFVIEEHFIPEEKCLRGTFAAEHDVQVFGYSKFFGLPTSLLLDFGKQSLAWKRLIFASKDTVLPEVTPPG
jgi:GxxExxY protein